jgi:hypothetical protein
MSRIDAPEKRHGRKTRFWRGGRVVECAGLEIRYTVHTVSRVRIPPSPPDATRAPTGALVRFRARVQNSILGPMRTSPLPSKRTPSGHGSLTNWSAPSGAVRLHSEPPRVGPAARLTMPSASAFGPTPCSASVPIESTARRLAPKSAGVAKGKPWRSAWRSASPLAAPGAVITAPGGSVRLRTGESSPDELRAPGLSAPGGRTRCETPGPDAAGSAAGTARRVHRRAPA